MKRINVKVQFMVNLELNCLRGRMVVRWTRRKRPSVKVPRNDEWQTQQLGELL